MTDYKEAYYLEKNRELTKALLKIKAMTASPHPGPFTTLNMINKMIGELELTSDFDPDNVPPDEP